MLASIQMQTAEAMNDFDALAKLDDRELLATEWLWALRDRATPIRDLTNEQLRSLMIEDLLTVASFEGQGRQLAQTADGMMRFLDGSVRTRVIQACFSDKRITALIVTDEDNRIQLDPRHIPAAMRLAGIN
jgi:hypothetical protein